jgi:hypothetical protein
LNWTIGASDVARNKLSDVDLLLDGSKYQFRTIYKLQPSIGELIEKLNSIPPDTRLLLVTPQLSPRILDFCHDRGISAIDLNGQAYLRAKGLLVERPPVRGRNFRFELEPRNVFVGKSCQIIRTLLTDRDRSWVQSELVARTNASSGLVSRIVSHLVLQGFAEKVTAREIRLTDTIGLVNGWAKADDFNHRVTTSRYSVFGTPNIEQAHALLRVAKDQPIKIAFTQWIAGWLRVPYTEPPVVSAYVSQLPTDEVLESLSFRPVTEGGGVWLHVPRDEGVFLETQIAQELPLVSDAQIVVDLSNTGLRGPDQAAALLDWEGFCRP